MSGSNIQFIRGCPAGYEAVQEVPASQKKALKPIVEGYAGMEWNALKKLAKERGIVTKGLKKPDVLAALEAQDASKKTADLPEGTEVIS